MSSTTAVKQDDAGLAIVTRWLRHERRVWRHGRDQRGEGLVVDSYRIGLEDVAAGDRPTGRPPGKEEYV